MGSYVSVQVKESRNAYAKKTNDYGVFAVGTLVSTIATFLGLNGSITSAILSCLGIIINVSDYICDSVRIARSASYSYMGKRSGSVYFNGNYIKVLEYSNKGEFHGGYLSTGEFDWIEFKRSTAYNNSYEDVATGAVVFFDNWLNP